MNSRFMRYLLPFLYAAVLLWAYMLFLYSPSVTDEEYAIYSVLIKDFLESDNAPVVIQDRTTISSEYDRFGGMLGRLGKMKLEDYIDQKSVGEEHYRTVERMHREFQKDLSKELIADFLRKDRNRAVIEDRFTSGIQCVLISRKGEIQLSAENRRFWKEFYKRYSDAAGLIHFSRIGFNKGKTRALLYAEFSRASLWGEGTLYILEKHAGQWTIINYSNLWIS